MTNFSVVLKIFKYSHLKRIEEKIFEAKNKADAKRIAKGFMTVTEWAMDLTPIPDLRTLKIAI